MNPREKIDSAMGELSALPSFNIFLSWLDEQREESVTNLSQPGIAEGYLRWEGGRVSMIDEIREIVIDNGISSDSYELTGRSAPAHRPGKSKEAV